MTTNKRVKLLADKPIPLAQQQSRIFAQMLTNDLADFTPQFPLMTSAFITNFETVIDTAESSPSTDQVKNAIKALKADVALKVKDSVAKTNELINYASLAFAGNDVKIDSYGKGKVTALSRKRPSLIKLMEENYDLANGADKPTLALRGWGNTKLSAYNTSKNNLRTADKLLGVAVKERKGKTDAYYAAQNNMWAIVQEIHTAAQVVYADNPAKRSAYNLYPERDSPSDLAITMDIADVETPAVHQFLESMQPTQTIHFRVLEGNGAGFACFGTTASGPWTGAEKTLNPGEDALYSYADFGGSGQFLRIRQVGTVPMKVRVRLPGE